MSGGLCPSTREWKIKLNVFPGQPNPWTTDKIVDSFHVQSGKSVCYLLRRGRDIKSSREEMRNE